MSFKPQKEIDDETKRSKAQAKQVLKNTLSHIDNVISDVFGEEDSMDDPVQRTQKEKEAYMISSM